MRLIALAAAVTLATACSAFARAEPACDNSPLLIENVRFHDDAAPQSILIKDGRIRWVGGTDAGRPALVDNTRILDGRGATALPGLIDSHTHFDALPAAKHLQAELDIRTEIYPITMRQTLASGVTTARIHLAALADMAVLQKIADDDCFPAPRLVLSGPGLLGGAPALDGRLMRGVENEKDLSEKIDQLVARGAEWIALHAPAKFTAGERAAIRAAKETHNIRFMADADSFENFSAALNLPISSAEYLNRSEATQYPDAILSSISARQAPLYLSAPVGYYRRSVRFSRDAEREIDPAVFMFVPDAIANEMRAGFSNDFDDDSYIARAVSSFPTMKAKFDQLRAAGAVFVITSDSGSLGQFHHDAVWAEFAAWDEFGASAKEILEAATSAPAAMLERNDIGAIAVGARGDIVLIDGAFGAGGYDREQVRTVVKGGVIFVENGVWRGPDAAEMAAQSEK